ncbi:hypothetical protein FFH21_003865 [Pseudomonas sp. KBS0707]|nr:hypothetical protein FFH21_003865 [Pseudomonas sp. KBS0707]
MPVCSKTSDTVFLLSNNVAMVVMLRWRNAFRFNGKSRIEVRGLLSQTLRFLEYPVGIQIAAPIINSYH